MADFVEMQAGFGNPAFIFFLIFILLVFGLGCVFFV